VVDAGMLERPLVAIPALFGAGLLTSLTPCVYPMIPITAGILGGAGARGRSRLQTLRLTLLYVLGLALVYATLGLIAGLTGSLFGTISSNPWAYFLFGNLLLLAGAISPPGPNADATYFAELRSRIRAND